MILTFQKVIRTVWEWTGIRYHKPRQWKIKLNHIEILKFRNFQKIIWKKKLTNLFYSFCISLISFYSLAIVCAKNNLDLVTWCTFFLFIEQTASFGWAWFVPKFVSNVIVRLVFFLQDVKSWSVLVYYFYDNQSHNAQNVMLLWMRCWFCHVTPIVIFFSNNIAIKTIQYQKDNMLK